MITAKLRKTPYDVMLAPFGFLPLTWRGPSVVVLHNILAFGDLARRELSPLRALYRERAISSSLRRATIVLTVSDYLRKLVLDHFTFIDPSRVGVAHYGLSTELLSSAPEAQTSARRKNVLVVSALWPYKRVDQAIEAFALATAEEPDAVLRIAGPGTPTQLAASMNIARRWHILDRVLFLGNVPHSRLGQLYAESDAVLHLSEIESFGLPVLEAMGTGIPVLAKRIGGIPEVAGEAAIWIPPNAEAGHIAGLLRRVLSDDTFRVQHIRAGRREAAQFSWARNAELTARALRRAVTASKQPPGT